MGGKMAYIANVVFRIYKIMVNKVTFVRCVWAIVPPGSVGASHTIDIHILHYALPAHVYTFMLQYALCHIAKCGFTSWLQHTLVVENLRSVEDYQAGRAKDSRASELGKTVGSLVSPKYKSTARQRWLEALKVSKQRVFM